MHTTKRRIGAGIAAGMVAGTALLGAAPAFAASPAPAAQTVSTGTQCQVPEVKSNILRGPVIFKIKNTTDKAIHVRLCGNYSQGFHDQDLQPGEVVTGGGQSSGDVDVMANITFANGDQVDAWGGNPTIGYPWVGFGSTSGSNWERFSVGESTGFNQSGHAFEVIRDADQGNNSKWFQVNVKN